MPHATRASCYEDPTVLPLIERLVDRGDRVCAAARTPGSGNSAPCRGTTRSRRRCAGWRRIAARNWPRRLGQPDRAADGGAWADSRARAHPRRAAYNERLGYFTQALDGQHPDASNLLLPTLGHPRRARSALRLDRARLRALLVGRGLMLRYRHDDDFGETTSAFTICSFWWVEALAMMGDVDEAVIAFNRLRRPRQSARAVLRGRRAANGPPARQLPAGLHARRPDPRRDHHRRDCSTRARSISGRGRRGGEVPGSSAVLGSSFWVLAGRRS